MAADRDWTKQDEADESVILYPRSERNAEQKRLRYEARQARLKARPYWISCTTNRGYGDEYFMGYYRTEWGARLVAFFLTRGSKPGLTKVILTKKGR
jgi:hypothetical protein